MHICQNVFIFHRIFQFKFSISEFCSIDPFKLSNHRNFHVIFSFLLKYRTIVCCQWENINEVFDYKYVIRKRKSEREWERLVCTTCALNSYVICGLIADRYTEISVQYTAFNSRINTYISWKFRFKSWIQMKPICQLQSLFRCVYVFSFFFVVCLFIHPHCVRQPEVFQAKDSI